MEKRTVAIIQARLGSSRLPGKVLLDIEGHTLISRVVRRTKRAQSLHHLVVATSIDARDDAIVTECLRLEVSCLRGSETDVLDRYLSVARSTQAEVIVRITADCPLIDPQLLDTVVEAFHTHEADYASNTQLRTWPRGLDVEVFTRAALERAWTEAREPWQRTHVTPYFYLHPQLFRLTSVVGAKNYSYLRWTVDTAEDLTLVRALYRHFSGSDNFDWHEALAVIEQSPELTAINQYVRHKSLEDG